MLIKQNRQLSGDDIARSEITPREVFENRRRVLRAMGAGALAATGLVGLNGEALATMTSPDAKAQKLAAKTNSKFVVVDKVTPYKDITSLQQFLRIRHGQGRSGAERAFTASDGRGRFRSKARSRTRRSTTSMKS